MTSTSRLVLFTRYPTPGEAKTRLIPALGAAGAADLHRRLTERTLGILMSLGLPVEVRSTGAPVTAFRGWLTDPGLAIVDQGEGDLGARMLRTFADGPALIVGSDIPGMTPEHVGQALVLLRRHDAVFGPAGDGGYWLVAMQRPLPALFADMPWGTDAVLAETRRRAALHGIDIAECDRLDDLDTPDDLSRWPDLLG